MTRTTMARRSLLWLSCALFLLVAPADAASKKDCKPGKCREHVDVCKATCEGSGRQLKKCRKRCKKEVVTACRADEVTCGDGGGPGGKTCQSYATTATCAARTLEPVRQDNFVCTGQSGTAQPCDAGHDTVFRVTTPWKTHAGECCVIDTCHGATAFGIYDNLAFPGIIEPGTSPITAPVTVGVQSLSNYFQKPDVGPIHGQWSEAAGSSISLLCSTPPLAKVVSAAGGVLVAFTRQDYLAYETHPVPPPTGTWDYVTLASDETSVSFAPPRPPLLPECGSSGDTLTCQPRLFKLDTVNFIGDRNPVTEVLSEQITLERLCDDAIYVSAAGTFRRLDGSECAIEIHGQAKIGCDTDADCTTGQVCTTTTPSQAVFATTFPGWSGKSCVVPTP